MLKAVIHWQGRDWNVEVNIYAITIGVLWTAVVWLFARRHTHDT